MGQNSARLGPSASRKPADGSPRSWLALAAPTSTRRIGRYLLGPEIAAGAVSVVHLGLLDGAEGFRRPVAIKRLRPQHHSVRAFSALRREAVLSSTVRHPNIVTVIDLVHDSGELFVVMEYVLGDNLAHLLRHSAPLSTGVAVRIALDMLNGLQAAHSSKSTSGELLHLIHRNVSPHNVLLGSDGIARITDFGVARSLASDALTVVGSMRGATGYMAPELVSGSGGDSRVDVFATGVVLWEMLTGTRLFKSIIAAEALQVVLQQGLQPPSQLNSRVPPKLDDVVLRALSGSPGQRPQSARAFSKALEDAATPASHEEVADFVKGTLRKSLAIQEAQLRALQSARPAMQLTPTKRQPSISEHDAPTAVVQVPERSLLTQATRPGDRRRSAAPRQAARSPAELGRGSVFLIALGTVALLTIGSWGLQHSSSIQPKAVSAIPSTSFGAAKPTAENFQPHAASPPTTSPENLLTVDDLPPSLPPASKRKPARAVRPLAASARPEQSPPTTCDPPFVVDSEGIKRIRPECY